MKKSNVYEQLANAIIDLKAQENYVDELRKKCLDDMKIKGFDKIENEMGLYTVYQTATWKFSQNVKDAEAKLKNLKEKEKEDGTATKLVSDTVKFTPNK